MKKFIICAMLFILSGTVVFAEKEDYRMMGAELPEIIHAIEETGADEGFGVSTGVDYAINGSYTKEEDIYNMFYDYLSPENLVKQNTTLYQGYYYIKTQKIYFSLDYSLGADYKIQAAVRAKQIAEVFNRFTADNPEYFYIMPRNYMYYYGMENGKVVIIFAPLIGYNFPGFSGTGEDLKSLKAKYYNLIKRIDEIKEELYFEGMSDLDKLILSHDYIIDNCAYYSVTDANGNIDYGDGYSYNSYGILVNKRGVCQGLSYAYACVLKALGMPIENVREIRSGEISHMWNFIKLDNKWYHVDLTWDDPVCKNASGVYDMNDDAYQYEFHDYFLISDATNTKKRNAEGYKNFTLEIVGSSEISNTLANDATYESGYFFNDPTNGSRSIQGRVEYEDGYYKKYYRNDDVYFVSDTLKAPDYLVSQITYNQYNVPMVWVLGAKERTSPNKNLIHYLGYYDKDGRLLKIKMEDRALSYFGMYPMDTFEEPEEGITLKIITLDSGFKPVANAAIMN